MPRVINFDKGSKRRLRQIQWSVAERASALALFLFLGLLCVQIALCDSSSEPAKPGPFFDLRH
jgi:hypothetical protein